MDEDLTEEKLREILGDVYPETIDPGEIADLIANCNDTGKHFVSKYEFLIDSHDYIVKLNDNEVSFTRRYIERHTLKTHQNPQT